MTREGEGNDLVSKSQGLHKIDFDNYWFNCVCAMTFRQNPLVPFSWRGGHDLCPRHTKVLSHYQVCA